MIICYIYIIQKLISRQLNLLDSHDTPRFITTAGNDFSALKLAWLFIFTYIGAPCIYYGDEIGLSGGPDPDCRASFNWNKEYWNQEIYSYAQSLIALRKTHPALRRGTFTRLYAKDSVFAFSRSVADETVFVVINAGNSTVQANIPAPQQLVQPVYKPIFGEPLNHTSQTGNLEINLAPRTGCVLLSGST